LVKGSIYGADKSEYRTIPDTFIKIVADAQNPLDGPISFKAWTPDGRLRQYGNTAVGQGIETSRYDAWNKKTLAQMRAWPIVRETDASGNYITYDYVTEKNNDAYNHTYVANYSLWEISYAGHNSGLVPTRRIRIWGDPRQTHQRIRYSGGMELASENQITRIEEEVAVGDQLQYYYTVREYGFGYDNTGPSGRPHLVGVSESTNPPNGPTRSTDFTWSDYRDSAVEKTIGFDQEPTYAMNKGEETFPHPPDQGDESNIPLGDVTLVLDYNGDGLPDIQTGYNYHHTYDEVVPPLHAYVPHHTAVSYLNLGLSFFWYGHRIGAHWLP
jgi:hypothetical protein